MNWPHKYAVRLVNTVRSVARGGRRVHAWSYHCVPGSIPSVVAGPCGNSDTPSRLAPKSAEVDAALTAWRRKGADILLIAYAAAYAPAVVLVMLGYSPASGLVTKAILIPAYLVVAAAALCRRVEYRSRLLAAFFVAYVSLAIANIVYPQGPLPQVGLVAVPILVLVLLGPRAARVAAVVSAVIIVSGPLLWKQFDVVRVLRISPAGAALPPGRGWIQVATHLAALFTLMVVLDRFYHFLLETLTERIGAQRNMEREMRERQHLERDIANIGDAERRSLGQELHDGVCQQVTAALLRCQTLGRQLERGGAPSGADFQTLSSLLAETIDDAHNVAQGLCPLEPDPDALAPALRALTKRTGEMAALHCDFHLAGEVHVSDPSVAQHVYRIAQEALSNAVRHAHASRIRVELVANDGHLMLQVEDDGTGLPPELPAGGMGLRNMAYRARIMEGEVTVRPAPGGGTCVTCRVPVLPVGVVTAEHHA